MMMILSSQLHPALELKEHWRLRPQNQKQRSIFSVAAVRSRIACSSRRNVFVGSSSLAAALAMQCCLAPLKLKAEEKVSEDDGLYGAIKSLLDSDEETKSGRLLPKAYLKSAREVVKTLRESLNEDPNDVTKFRRTADAAKESIREYMGSWTGQKNVSKEESYIELEKAIRSLAKFYSRAGPFAPLSEEVRTEILLDLSKAEEFL